MPKKGRKHRSKTTKRRKDEEEWEGFSDPPHAGDDFADFEPHRNHQHGKRNEQKLTPLPEKSFVHQARQEAGMNEEIATFLDFSRSYRFLPLAERGNWAFNPKALKVLDEMIGIGDFEEGDFREWMESGSAQREGNNSKVANNADGEVEMGDTEGGETRDQKADTVEKSEGGQATGELRQRTSDLHVEDVEMGD